MTGNKKEIQIHLKKGEKEAELRAKLAVMPEFNACYPIGALGVNDEVCHSEILTILQEKSKKIKEGDISELESMLYCQAQMLQSVFAEYTHKMIAANYINQSTSFSKIAFKAQNQCRQTISALADIKNPKRTTFIKNQAHNQQVNYNKNSEKKLNESNELLKEVQSETVDTGGTKTPIAADKEMEAVEK
jgi:HD superfamily phosphohydrolase